MVRENLDTRVNASYLFTMELGQELHLRRRP